MGSRLIALALTALLGLGCFVLEELDGAEKLLDKPSFSQEQEREEKKSVARTEPEAAPKQDHSDRPSEGQWWKKTRSLTSGQIGDGLVRCDLGGTTQFMHRPNCLARGGTPRQAGG
jgi:hypothetical protein